MTEAQEKLIEALLASELSEDEIEAISEKIKAIKCAYKTVPSRKGLS